MIRHSSVALHTEAVSRARFLWLEMSMIGGVGHAILGVVGVARFICHSQSQQGSKALLWTPYDSRRWLFDYGSEWRIACSACSACSRSGMYVKSASAAGL